MHYYTLSHKRGLLREHSLLGLSEWIFLLVLYSPLVHTYGQFRHTRVTTAPILYSSRRHTGFSTMTIITSNIGFLTLIYTSVYISSPSHNISCENALKIEWEPSSPGGGSVKVVVFFVGSVNSDVICLTDLIGVEHEDISTQSSAHHMHCIMMMLLLASRYHVLWLRYFQHAHSTRFSLCGE